MAKLTNILKDLALYTGIFLASYHVKNHFSEGEFEQNYSNDNRQEIVLEKKEIVLDKHRAELKEYTPIEGDKIDSLFSYLNSNLKNDLNKVYIIDKRDFFDENIEAHTHDDGTVCLPLDYSHRTVFHESAHARHMSLDKMGSDFSKRWKEIADFEYVGYGTLDKKDGFEVWEDRTTEPKEGLLTPYSSSSILEDVANFVENLGYEESPKEFIERVNEAAGKEVYSDCSSYFCDTTDSRYQEKLDLLKEYGFFTEKCSCLE